jgi:hypothetical protein
MRCGTPILLGSLGLGLVLALLIGVLVSIPALPAVAAGLGGQGPEPPRCLDAATCPDLAIRSVRIIMPPPGIRHQPRTTFQVEMVNNGGVPARASNTALRLFTGDRQIAFADIWTRQMEAGESRLLSLTVPGRFDETIHCAFLVADSRAWVDEIDENNNLLTIGACGR